MTFDRNPLVHAGAICGDGACCRRIVSLSMRLLLVLSVESCRVSE